MWIVLLALSSPTEASELLTGNAEVERLLSGLVPGQPQQCISPRFLRGSEIVDGTAVIYRGPGDKRYVQRPLQNADQLRAGDVIISMSPAGSLCQFDTAELVDQSTRIRIGSVTFGSFIPYERPEHLQ